MDGLDPCRARALYLSGLKTPNDVLRAPEEVIKKALSKALPSEMKRHDDVHVQKGTHAAVQVGLGAHIGANTLLNRSVQSVTSMVHKHLWQKAADQHLELPDPQDAPVQLTQATELSTCPASVPGPRCIPAHAQRLTQGPTWAHPLSQGTSSDVRPQEASLQTQGEMAECPRPPDGPSSALIAFNLEASQPPPYRLTASQPAAPSALLASQPECAVAIHSHAQNQPVGSVATVQFRPRLAQPSGLNSAVETPPSFSQRAGSVTQAWCQHMPVERAVPACCAPSHHNHMHTAGVAIAMPAARDHAPQVSAAAQPAGAAGRLQIPARVQQQPAAAQPAHLGTAGAAHWPRCSEHAAQSQSQHHPQQQNRYHTQGDAAHLQHAQYRNGMCSTPIPHKHQPLPQQRDSLRFAHQGNAALLRQPGPPRPQCLPQPTDMHSHATCHAIAPSNIATMHQTPPTQSRGSSRLCEQPSGASQNSAWPARSSRPQCSHSAPSVSQMHHQSCQTSSMQPHSLPQKHARSNMSYEQDLWTNTKTARLNSGLAQGSGQFEAACSLSRPHVPCANPTASMRAAPRANSVPLAPRNDNIQ